MLHNLINFYTEKVDFEVQCAESSFAESTFADSTLAKYVILWDVLPTALFAEIAYQTLESNNNNFFIKNYEKMKQVRLNFFQKPTGHLAI